VAAFFNRNIVCIDSICVYTTNKYPKYA
jgi:hypothetical protein